MMTKNELKKRLAKLEATLDYQSKTLDEKEELIDQLYIELEESRRTIFALAILNQLKLDIEHSKESFLGL